MDGAKKKSQGKFKKCMELKGNEKTMYQNLWNTAKAALTGKFIALNTSIQKEEKSWINKLKPPP